MRKFKIGYSNNGFDWKMIMDDSKCKVKFFEGNNNYDIFELWIFLVFFMWFIRIYFERVIYGGLGFWMELLGCEVEVFIVGLIIFNGNLVDECDDD